MKVALSAVFVGVVLLTGCVPNLVSVSKDGTIALMIKENGDFNGLDGEVYLTNANADFLTKVEDLNGCVGPNISPSGRFIAAVSEDHLVLYEREKKDFRSIYRVPEKFDSWPTLFQVWAPDETKIAFFAGDPDSEPPRWNLYVYDLERRELQLVARDACPRATWSPDGERLLYISFPQGVSEGGDEPPFGDLRIFDVETAEERVLVRRQFVSFSRAAAFPAEDAILFPCILWDRLEITASGMTVPLVLKKQRVSVLGETSREEIAEPPSADTNAKPVGEKPSPEPPVAEPPKEFVFEEGQPFHPHMIDISPDGKKIAYARVLRTATGSPEADAGNTEQMEGWEVCVANADATGSILVHQQEGSDVSQVFWTSNTRLLCISDGSIYAVDSDGKNKIDLIETLKTKFADRFKKPEPQEQPGASTPGSS
jgi:hypothetical protein